MNQQITEFRIVLVGKTGVGKSSTGNTILGKQHFHKAASSKSVTKECSRAINIIEGKTVTVLDTPGWCDTELSEAELTQATVKCIDMSYPGPHVFLFVLAIGNRFTAEEKKTVQKIQEIFGEQATRYTMILFTRGDDLEDVSIDDYLKGAAEELQALVSKYNGRYHVFNNKDKSRNQVSVLLQKIQDMVQHNGGECYTNSTYQLMETYKKREAELEQEANAAQKKMQDREAELQRRIQIMEQEHQLREAQLREQLKQKETDNVIAGAVVVSLLEQMQISAKAAEQQQKINAESQKQRDDWLRHQRRLQEEETKRQSEEYEHRRRMERERLNFEQEKKDTERSLRAQILKLEEQKKQAEAEREEILKQHLRKNRCIIS